MIFTPTPLAGALVIDMERVTDERGFFARSYCTADFAAQGLPFAATQCSVSFNPRQGTLRGLHFQAAPDEEDKLVRCTAGAVFDVLVDMRVGSPTYRHWFGTELTARNHRALYVPKGLAHGFISLVDDTEVFYMISVAYVAGGARGVRWNDPALGIRWPLQPVVMSVRDATHPLLEPA